MVTFGLCMIVRNEQHNLPRLLDSVSGLFDQLVVVDTGSEDDTKQVALTYGAELYDFVWVDDFAAARNFSFDQCRCDYTVWLDADDELSPEARSRLLELKRGAALADTYLLPYSYMQDRRDEPLVLLYRHRVVRNTPEVRWRWPIHECLSFPSWWTQQLLAAPVIHRRSQQDAAADVGRNLRLLRAAVAAEPTEPRLLFYLGKELFADGRLEEALEALERYYATGGGWHDDQINGHYIAAMALWQLGRDDEAIDRCLVAIKQDPRWAEFYVLVGQIHYNHQRWGQAIPWFKLASRLDVPDTLGTVILDNYGWVPHDRLCKCYGELGRLPEAYLANERALAQQPTEQRLLYNREYLCDILFPGRKAPRPVRLSLGSGGKHTAGYRCTDLHQLPGVEEVFDQMAVPYPDASVHAIYSEHTLEHLGREDAAAAVADWARVLRHGGHLLVRVPDLDQCCEKFVLAEDRERQEGENWTPKEWYSYTIYGIQRSLAGEPATSQYHRTGFTAASLSRLLQRHGFELRGVRSYDGYGTPSLEAEAVQVRQPIKVAWMISGTPDRTHGSLRIRRLNVHRWLQQRGVDSRIIDHTTPEGAALAERSDVAVFCSFGPEERELLERLRRRGVKCVYDHCEDLDGLPHQTDCFQQADMIVCCSTLLAQRAADYGRTTVIADAFEEQ